MGDAPRDKDELLRWLLGHIAERGIARKWAASATPRADLGRECDAIAADPEQLKRFGSYLAEHPIIRRTVRSFLEYMSVASYLRPAHAPADQASVFSQGISIARWIPTALVIDGPLGHFLRDKRSPLNQLLIADARSGAPQYPTLGYARDAFNHDLFRRIRNGLGHWSFVVQPGPSGNSLICFDPETGDRTAEASLLEAEALHLLSFATIEALDRGIFDRALPPV